MDSSKEGKRRRNRNEEDDEKRRLKKSRRDRSRSISYETRRDRDNRRKRRHSKSRSPDVKVKNEKNDEIRKDSEKPKQMPDRPERKAKETDMLNTRTGGAYIPPARLRMMQAQITDKSSIAYQRLAWEALKKSIHGHINKINVGNIGIIIKELLKENIVRGRGLLCRSVIQAQAASPTFTNVYAALVAAVNSRFPNIGELLLKRLVIQFKRGFKRNDKSICISSASFIAHLVNQRVAHEILALELLTLLVETPTDDSVEVAIAFLKECGQKLTEVSSKGVNAIFEMLRNILHEGQLDKRVQYMIEVMFQVWKDGFKDHPALIEELEMVPEEEQFTHLLMLDDATDPQDILNVFKFDDKYEENEQKYKTLCKEILGSDAESGEEDGSGESGSEESEEEEEEKKEMTIIDNTETNLVALRRTIYLTINSSLDFEECAHKLMKMQLKPGQEVELCHMFLDCCAEQRTYEKFYGLLAQRFCNINRIYIGPFEEIFKDSYSTAHRLDTNRLRNVSKFFAHLLFTDSISWEALECVKLNEEDTTSSSRIYIKILFQELAEYMGLKKLNDRLQDQTLQDAFSGIFPRDNPRNTRFSINFFTSIGLGGLTDELREHLKQMPKNVPVPITEINDESESSSESSSSSSSSSSDSSSDSESSDSEAGGNKKKKKEKSKSKKKSKDNNPEEANEVEKNKNVERWGHDGFYDTYGKDARRMESTSNKERERSDRGQFAKPREFRQDRNWNNDQQNGSRRSDRDKSDDPRRRDEDKTRDRIPDQSRRRRDYDIESEENRRYEDSRNRRRERDDDGRESSRRGREDESRESSKKGKQCESSESSKKGREDEMRESSKKGREVDIRESRKHSREDDKGSSRRGRENDNIESSRRERKDASRESSRQGKDDKNRNSTKRGKEDNSKEPYRRARQDDDNKESDKRAREDDKQKDRHVKEDKDRRRDRDNRREDSSDDDEIRKRQNKRQKESKKEKTPTKDSSEEDSDSDDSTPQMLGRYWDRFDIDKNGEMPPEKLENSRDRRRQRS